jgi:penicillin-binding protein 1A
MYVSLREGLTASHNNVAAWLLQDVGSRKTVAMAERLGIRQSRLDAVPSLALGTSPVTLLEMASVYATIAAEGVYHEPLLVTSIVDSTGAVVAEYVSEPVRVLSQDDAVALTDMLRDVVDRGTGQRIRHQFGIRADVGGKTGTTQDNVDGWFMMIHPHLASGAWVGFDDPRIRFRSDFWGQGAHNALFVVGDVYRQASANGALSLRARFADPPRRRGDLYFADGRRSWFGRQFNRVAEAFGRGDGEEDDDSDETRLERRRASRDRHAEQTRRLRAEDAARRRATELADRAQSYARLKQQLAEIVENIEGAGDIGDQILEAYKRERESNPELRELEAELEIRVHRWLSEVEADLNNADW